MTETLTEELDENAPLAAESCEAALRRLVLGQAEALDAALAVFLEGEAPEGPHKARVALRRLTTALEAFQPILRRKGVGALRKAAKRYFRDLGAVRDSDVYTAARAGQAGHARRLAANLALRDKMRARLRKAGVVAFSARARAAVAAESGVFRRSAAAQALRAAPLADHARASLQAAWARCLRHGAALSSLTPEGLHDFRKDMKRLRYLAEFFVPVLPGLAAEPFASDLRAIQDDLGLLTDFAVAHRIEGRLPPARLPPREARALAAAAAGWQRLRATALPWAA